MNNLKRALVVWGGWEGHTPKASVDVFIPLLIKGGFEVDVRDSLSVYADSAVMEKQDLIVQCFTMGKIEKEQAMGLLSRVGAGAGFAGWHGGIIDSFREDTGYQWMTGGQWVAHPGNCIPSHSVEIADPDHEIVKGIKAFSIQNSEQYYIHVDPGVHVICNTVFSGEHGDKHLYRAGTVMPYAYTKQYGKGRIFVSCWGHTNKDFDIPEAREITLRGLIWAAGS